MDSKRMNLFDDNGKKRKKMKKGNRETKSLGQGKPALGVGMCVSRSRLFSTKPSNKLGGSRKALAHGNGKPPGGTDSDSPGSPHNIIFSKEDITRMRLFEIYHDHDLCDSSLYDDFTLPELDYVFQDDHNMDTQRPCPSIIFPESSADFDAEFDSDSQTEGGLADLC